MIKKDNVNHIMDLPRWKKKSKVYILFLIRFAETFAANFVPSVIGILLIFNNPNTRVWTMVTIMSFICSLTVNCLCWNKYVRSRNDVKSFYLVNLTIYLFYAALSVLMVHKTGYVLFTVMFSNLRVGEIIGLSTIQSVYATNAVMLAAMAVCERISSVRLNKRLSIMAENGADAVEMVNVDENAVPTQSDTKVRFLSPAELHKSDEEDADRFRIAVEKEIEQMPDKIWDENMTKGRGETVEYEHEHDDEEETNAHADYSADSLWDSGIYRGRTPESMPLTEYGEDDFAPELPDETDDAADEPLWNSDFHQGRGDTDTLPSADDAEENEKDDSPFEDYAPDSLWSSDIRQGQSDADVSFEEDFEESVDKPEDTMLSDYDADNLWGNISRGRDTQKPSESWEETESVVNPNSDYDADALWSKDIYQGKNKEENGRGKTAPS